jgi:hypothetical protein
MTMSKFIDKLNSIASGGAAPMGFRVAGAKPRPKMALVAHVAAEAKADGADAILLAVPKATRSLKKPKAKVLWGGWLKEVSAAEVKRLVEGGADFVVFPAASVSSAIIEDEKLGKIVEVEADIEASLLKSIDDLPIDAVLIAGEKPSLSWQDLMLFRRGANVLSKPLLVVVSPDVTASELQALCEAGVAGVVAGANVDKLRKAIDKLTSPKAGKRRKAEPLLPRIGGGVETIPEEEEEED